MPGESQVLPRPKMFVMCPYTINSREKTSPESGSKSTDKHHTTAGEFFLRIDEQRHDFVQYKTFLETVCRQAIIILQKRL